MKVHQCILLYVTYTSQYSIVLYNIIVLASACDFIIVQFGEYRSIIKLKERQLIKRE